MKLERLLAAAAECKEELLMALHPSITHESQIVESFSKFNFAMTTPLSLNLSFNNLSTN